MGILWSKPAPEDVGFDADRYSHGHTRDDSAGLPLEREPSPAADGQMQWQPDQQAVWVPDSAHRQCMLCKMAFGWFQRRHHCRQCGSLVCQECSPHRALARGYMVPQRVCSGCMGALIMAEQSAAASRRQSADRDARSRQASSASRRSANTSAASSRQNSRRASREETRQQQSRQQQHDHQRPPSPQSIAAPVPVRGTASTTVLVLHGESSSSVKATASSASTAAITTSVASAGLPPPHTSRSSRPASPSASLAADQQPFSTHHSNLSLSVGGAVTSTASTIVDSPSAAAGATSIRRPSITAASREHSPTHSPRRRKSISGSPAFQMPLPAASTAAAAAVPASFVVESLPPLVLFNRLAGFGSLLVLDVRSAEHYREGHVPRALNLPLSDGDLLAPEDVQRALQPAECTAMLAALEQRLHVTDQRAFRMRQRCTIVIVGQPAEETLSADAAAAATAAAAAAAAPCSLTPLMSAAHSPLCLHLARLLLLEGKVAAVSVVGGGFPAFQRSYPFVCCAYTALECRTGKHIHKKPFPWFPNEVVQGALFLGSKVDAANLDHLKQIRVRAILNCTTEIPNHFEDEMLGEDEMVDEEQMDANADADAADVGGADGVVASSGRRRFTYSRIELHDEVTVSISSHFEAAFAFLDAARARGARVLVHCQEGISRSSTIVIAWLMARQGLSLQDAYAWVKAQRKQIFPNLGFWRQLDLFERTLIRQRMVEAGGPEAAVPALEDIRGTMDRCIDVALLTAEYEARKAATEGRKAELQAEAEAAPSSSSSPSSLSADSDLTPSQRVQRAVLAPTVARSLRGGGTMSRVTGVAGDDAKTRAEEAVVEEAQTPCGPIVTSE